MTVFQSTPAHQDGRNALEGAGLVERQFQSTPAHQDGRNTAVAGLLSMNVMFQSTPAHQDGRNGNGWAEVRCRGGFNPLPPTRTGETPGLRQWPDGGHCFNPLPPTRTGETHKINSHRQIQAVSIHSRPPGREKRVPTRSTGLRCPRFNPLPPTRTGETRVAELEKGREEVSIHSRPPGREKRAYDMNGNVAFGFQSTPAHQDGRNDELNNLLAFKAPVSIHSRPPGREKHAVIHAQRCQR